MSTIDVRVPQDEVRTIKFHDGSVDGDIVASKLEVWTGRVGVKVMDRESFVAVANKQHATDLIKALNKAIELGWLG